MGELLLSDNSSTNLFVRAKRPSPSVFHSNYKLTVNGERLSVFWPKWPLVLARHRWCKRTGQESTEKLRGTKHKRRKESIMTFLATLGLLLAASAPALTSAQSTTTQPSFFLQDPSDGECMLLRLRLIYIFWWLGVLKACV